MSVLSREASASMPCLQHSSGEAVAAVVEKSTLPARGGRGRGGTERSARVRLPRSAKITLAGASEALASTQNTIIFMAQNRQVPAQAQISLWNFGK